MFYVPKAIKAIFLSALIGSISVRQSHQFPWGFQLKCALPFLFIFTLQPATKGGSEPQKKQIAFFPPYFIINKPSLMETVLVLRPGLNSGSLGVFIIKRVHGCHSEREPETEKYYNPN